MVTRKVLWRAPRIRCDGLAGVRPGETQSPPSTTITVNMFATSAATSEQRPALEAAGAKNGNPPGIGLFALLREDLRTHDGKLFEQGFWALAVHRFGNWRMDIRPKLLRAPFSLLYRFLYRVVEWTCGISLPYTVKVGRRVRIWHHGAMILHARSIGDDVHIRHATTFGIARTHDRPDQIPTIGNGVDIGCHACVLGPITLGDGCRIGAGSVVLHDIPPGATAVGSPARISRTGTSADHNRTNND